MKKINKKIFPEDFFAQPNNPREKEIFNHIIDNRSELCESLIEMNNKIASKQMKAYYELYLQKKDEKKQAEEKKTIQSF